MKFDDSFDKYMSLYNEAKEAPKGKHYDKAGRLQSGDADSDGRGGPKFRSDPTYKNPNENEEGKKKKGLTGLALLAQQEQGEKIGRDGKGLGPDSREEKSEDNETAKKVAKVAGKAIKGTAKLAGKSALAFADYMTGGDVSKGIDFVKSSYEDCETCGCEEKPEYGHLDDTYSNYIDQYKEPAEDAEGKRCDYVPCEDGEAGCECGNCPDCMPAEDGERVDKDRMKCNKPRRTSGGSKKFVVKACENGKEKVVRFGDPNMKIKKSNPKRRKSFRARHKCDQKKSKFSAGYWSCKKW